MGEDHDRRRLVLRLKILLQPRELVIAHQAHLLEIEDVEEHDVVHAAVVPRSPTARFGLFDPKVGAIGLKVVAQHIVLAGKRN